MRYVKQKSTGRYLHAESGGDPSKPEHLQIMLDDVSRNRSIDLSDLEAGYGDDVEIVAEYQAQDLAVKTYAEKRRMEYPSILELTVALYDTDDKAAIEKRRADVKAKYPKP